MLQQEGIKQVLPNKKTIDEGESVYRQYYSQKDEEDSGDDLSSFEEERINVTIPKFPIQLICMENCEDTFDNLILEKDLSTEEWLSALMQIIMILITYQKAFSFTHNDLHTNNVMYNKTHHKFLYYK